MTLETILTTFEDWTLRVRPGKGPASRVLLLLHGWTGDENSMWPFARRLPADWWILAPRAPYPAVSSGYSWRAPASGWPTLETMRPSAVSLADLLERWGVANSVETASVDVAGFSQGGAMSLVFGLLYPQRVNHLAVLAGFLPAESDSLLETRPLSGKTVFWAHGTQDEMVPLEMARLSMDLILKAGAQLNYFQAETGHKVSAEGLRALEAYLQN
ncbi:MAG: alpha/beta fold hydrolase [Anaerolineales bacterium]